MAAAPRCFWERISAIGSNPCLHLSEEIRLNKFWSVFLVVSSAVLLSALGELAPLRNWAAPLFWQPSRAEAENIARSGISGGSGELALR